MPWRTIRHQLQWWFSSDPTPSASYISSLDAEFHAYMPARICGNPDHRSLSHGQAGSAQRYQANLRRDAEAERHDAAAEPPGDDDIAVHADVAIGEPLPGRRHRRPAEQPYLTTMGMSGQLHRDARGHASSHIGFMRQKNERRVVRYLLQGRGKIIDADAFDRPEPPRREIGQLIAETCEPELVTVLAQALDVILVNRNADGFERAPGDRRSLPIALHRLVVPPIVIAEDRMHAKRRLEPGENRRPFAGGNMARHMAMPGHIVAKHDDDIGVERIGAS